MTPKSLLRHKLAVSPVEHFATGRFHEVLDDPADRRPGPPRPRLLRQGLLRPAGASARRSGKTREVAIVRLEQFYPWPAETLKAALGRYRSAREWVWVQEESQNMGGWTFVAPRLQELMGSPSSTSAATPAPARRPARTASTTASRPSWSRRPSARPCPTWSRPTRSIRR